MQDLYSLWRDFWKFTGIKNHTINWIDSPRIGDINFMIPLYLVLILSFIIFILKFRTLTRQSLIKALIFSSISAGILFAVRLDYTWFMNWQQDRKYLYSKSVYDRQTIVFPAPWPNIIAADIKNIVPPGKSVRLYVKDSIFRAELKYFLLPVEVSDSGSFITVYDDTIQFDPVRNTLAKDNQIIAANAVPIYKIDKVTLYLDRGQYK